jgi:hypothetical protein
VTGLSGLEAGKAEVTRGYELGFPVLRLSADFRAARTPLPDILIAARLGNRAAPDQIIQQFLMAPYRIYPPHRWQAGETVRLKANILLPDILPSGVWVFQLIGMTKREGLRLPPEMAAAFYRHFDTAMAINYLPQVWGVAPEQLMAQHQLLYLPGALTTP